MRETKNLPVLILGYNRFNKFTRCISTLEKQGLKNIYVSIDGPKNDYDKEAQKNIINFCKRNTSKLDIKFKNLDKIMAAEMLQLKVLLGSLNKTNMALFLKMMSFYQKNVCNYFLIC